MNKTLRAGLVAAVFFGTYVLSWLVLLFFPLGDLLWIGNLIALGSIGFAGGFFGPMIFAPGANQGPMLGIFITGPIGVLLGALAGLYYGVTRLPRRS